MFRPVINLNGSVYIQSPSYSQINAKSDVDPCKVSVFDRGFLYGDSLYEVIRTYRKIPFHLQDHLKRLCRSAELCYMRLTQSPKQIETEIEVTLEKFFISSPDVDEAYIRVIITRGVGRIGFGLGNLESPNQLVIIVQPLDLPPAEKFESGLALKTVKRLRNDPRALDPAMKSGNYLNNLLAYLEATTTLDNETPLGEQWLAEDALLCDAEGFLTEGPTFNIFYIKRGILATPPLDVGILDGITRKLVLELASGLKIQIREVRFPKERLYEADEVFISSSIREVFPVTIIDSNRIGNKKPGPLTMQLADAFKKRVL